jgi:carboxymethylenebutenolidase
MVGVAALPAPATVRLVPIPGEVLDRSALEEATPALREGEHSFSAYAAWPRDAAAAPGILVVHEAYGVNAHIEDVCRRFAAQGFAALAPDLFARVGGPPDPGDLARVVAKIGELRDADAVSDMRVGVEWLRAQPRSNGRIGAIGFCMGGRLSLLLATHAGVLDAAVDCWGGRITRRTATVDDAHPDVVVERVDQLSCPLLGIFGAEDQNPNSDDVDELRAALQQHGKAHRIVVYKDAGHALFADYRPSYNETAANAAWGEMLDWFAQLR